MTDIILIAKITAIVVGTVMGLVGVFEGIRGKDMKLMLLGFILICVSRS